MDGDIQTVSLGNWMELPNLKLSDVVTEAPGKRVHVSSVANYYQEYVKRKELCRSFINHAEVTSVKAITQCEMTCSTASANQKKKYYDREPTPEENAIFQNDENLWNQDQEKQDLDNMDASCFPDSASDSNTLASSPSQCDCSSFSSQSLRDFSIPRQQDIASRDTPDLPCALLDNEEERFLSGADHHDPNGLTIQRQNNSSADENIIGGRRSGLLGYSYMDECSSRDGGYEEYTMDPDLSTSLAWDPIVNPDLFASKSVGSSSKFGSSLNRNRTLSNNLTHDTKRCSVQVRDCFNTDRLFQVRGFKTVPNNHGRLVQEDFSYMAKNVVLATGSYDLPNKLAVRGEKLPFVLHSLQELEKEIASGLITKDSDPIMIVGAGLSAADAISTAMNEKIPIVHVFRRAISDPSIVFNKLPKALYPEYHKIYRMMMSRRSPEEDEEGSYEVLDLHYLIRIQEDKEVEVSSMAADGKRKKINVSRVVILIGSSPNLDFLEEDLRKDLGIMKETPISRNNPVDINKETNEALNVPGIYAMGPLVGDNFVRFLQGGAMAIASDILKKENKGREKSRPAPGEI